MCYLQTVISGKSVEMSPIYLLVIVFILAEIPSAIPSQSAGRVLPGGHHIPNTRTIRRPRVRILIDHGGLVARGSHKNITQRGKVGH